MATYTTKVNPSSIDITVEGVTNRFSQYLDTSDPNRPLVVSRIERVGEGIADANRYHVTDSGQRVAVDSPGVSSAICIVDSSNHITNG